MATRSGSRQRGSLRVTAGDHNEKLFYSAKMKKIPPPPKKLNRFNIEKLKMKKQTKKLPTHLNHDRSEQTSTPLRTDHRSALITALRITAALPLLLLPPAPTRSDQFFSFNVFPRVIDFSPYRVQVIFLYVS